MHPAPHSHPPIATSTLHVEPWPDPVIDALGFEYRSPYLEFWLPVLGPSVCWLLRRISLGLEAHPAGFALDLEETAQALGLGAGTGRNSVIRRTIQRAVRYDLAQQRPGDVLAVRRRLAPLALRHLRRLPDSLQRDHEAWLAAHRPRRPTPGIVEAGR